MAEAKDAPLTEEELAEVERSFADWPELEPLTREEATRVARLVAEVRRLQALICDGTEDELHAEAERICPTKPHGEVFLRPGPPNDWTPGRS